MSPVCCADCHKTLDRIPLWLETVNVVFVCEDCRQKHRAPVKARAMMDMDPIVDDEAVADIDVAPEVEPEATVSLEVLAEQENRDADTADANEGDGEGEDADVDLDVILTDDDGADTDDI